MYTKLLQTILNMHKIIWTYNIPYNSTSLISAGHEEMHINFCAVLFLHINSNEKKKHAISI